MGKKMLIVGGLVSVASIIAGIIWIDITTAIISTIAYFVLWLVFFKFFLRLILKIDRIFSGKSETKKSFSKKNSQVLFFIISGIYPIIILFIIVLDPKKLDFSIFSYPGLYLYLILNFFLNRKRSGL